MWGVHGKKMYGFIIALLDVEIKLKDRRESSGLNCQRALAINFFCTKDREEDLCRQKVESSYQIHTRDTFEVGLRDASNYHPDILGFRA